MPQLTKLEYDQFKSMIEALEPELAKLDQTSRGFVEDQIERHEKYGEKTFVSPKQFQWLESLHTKHVGPIDAASAVGAERADLIGKDDDMDDEIPF